MARGYICGALPSWLVTINSVPAAREIECRHRASRTVVARTFSDSNGLYRFDGLPAADEFDIIGRDWTGTYNDVIWAAIRPVPYNVQSLSGAFGINNAARTLTGGLALIGGDAHVVSTTGTPPPGISFAVVVGEPPGFDHAGFWIVASGSTVGGSYTWDVIVTAHNGTQRTLACAATFT